MSPQMLANASNPVRAANPSISATLPQGRGKHGAPYHREHGTGGHALDDRELAAITAVSGYKKGTLRKHANDRI